MKTEIMKRELKRNKVWGKKELALVRIFFSLAPDFVTIYYVVKEHEQSKLSLPSYPCVDVLCLEREGWCFSVPCPKTALVHNYIIHSYTQNEECRRTKRSSARHSHSTTFFFFFFFGMCQGIQFRLKFILFNINPTKNSSKVVIKHDCCSHMLETSY